MQGVTPNVRGLAADHVIALRRLCAQFQVAFAVVFGSRAHGEAVAISDLDLLVLPAAGTPFDLLSFESTAQQIVGRLRVDVSVLHPALSSTIAWEALRDAIILWEEMPGAYEREKASWHRRFVEDAPRRRIQALQLSRMFRCP